MTNNNHNRKKKKLNCKENCQSSNYRRDPRGILKNILQTRTHDEIASRFAKRNHTIEEILGSFRHAPRNPSYRDRSDQQTYAQRSTVNQLLLYELTKLKATDPFFLYQDLEAFQSAIIGI